MWPFFLFFKKLFLFLFFLAFTKEQANGRRETTRQGRGKEGRNPLEIRFDDSACVCDDADGVLSLCASDVWPLRVSDQMD